jgi:predicted RNA-binding protein YlxR (DUF448 family)/ribosomal protein L7Ae-like RNA K-turn-binding protein
MPKHEPERSCLGCRTARGKGELLRFVLGPDRSLVADPQAKLPGRGAYTCWNSECLRKAVTRNQFARSFRGEVSQESPDLIIARLVRLREERLGAYLALANKAGKVVSGSEVVTEALRHGKAGVLYMAADISAESRERFLSLAGRNGVAIVEMFTKDQLGALLGKELRSVAVVEQSGFVTTIMMELGRYRNFAREGCSNHE